MQTVPVLECLCCGKSGETGILNSPSSVSLRSSYPSFEDTLRGTDQVDVEGFELKTPKTTDPLDTDDEATAGLALLLFLLPLPGVELGAGQGNDCWALTMPKAMILLLSSGVLLVATDVGTLMQPIFGLVVANIFEESVEDDAVMLSTVVATNGAGLVVPRPNMTSEFHETDYFKGRNTDRVVLPNAAGFPLP